MPQSYTQLVYVSRAKCDFDHDAVHALGESAARRNHSVGISGLLLYNCGHFLQLLEGPTRAVNMTYERIQADRRHTALFRLQYGESKAALFPNWSMGVLNPGELSEVDYAELESIMRHTSNNVRQRVMVLMQRFASIMPPAPEKIDCDGRDASAA